MKFIFWTVIVCHAVLVLSQTTNNENESETELKKQERELYPYGLSVGDSELSSANSSDVHSYWYDGISQPIYFPAGVPFGSQKVFVAHVLPNGVITFGKNKHAWWPDLEHAFISSVNLVAPFWYYTNPYQSGKVFYHLYEKESFGKTTSKWYNSPQLASVLSRASKEVQEFIGLSTFEAVTVLVATWFTVEPESWYEWICTYYQYYSNDWWWQQNYQQYYETYCFQQRRETNTFQAVYISDGDLAFVIVIYKKGEMNWLYDRYRTIAVGYVTSDTMRDYGVTLTDLTTRMDSIVWNAGHYGTWIEQVGKIKNPDRRCIKFYKENQHLISNITHQAYANALFKCPCNFERLGAQWWIYSWDEVPDSKRSYIVCYAISPVAQSQLERLQGNPLNKLCCYIYTSPDPFDWTWEAWQKAQQEAMYIPFPDPNAGHLLLNNPWHWSGLPDTVRKFKEEDVNPHHWCCQDTSSPSTFCALFNEVRPEYGCSLDAEIISGIAFGDPHIRTGDGKGYTLNGLGEYILLQCQEKKFMFQGRTGQYINNKGFKINATVFVAFAAKEGEGQRWQVELDSQKTGMIIMADGRDITQEFRDDEGYAQIFGDNGLSVVRKNRHGRITMVVFFRSGISVEVYISVEGLVFTVNVPTSLKGKTQGLMGNFNEDQVDDFNLPNDTVLPPEETDTDEEILKHFGKAWEVTSSNSEFTYPEGETALDYQFSDFKPMFVENADSALVDAARIMCRGNILCTYDMIATRDDYFANTTRSSDAEAVSIKIQQVNKLPVLSLAPNQLNDNQRWEVTHNQKATLYFRATDANPEDTITFVLQGNAGRHVSLDNETGILTYTPDYRAAVSFGVQARDSKGGLSKVIYVTMVVISDCSEHGVANKARTRENELENGRFLIYACNCWPAYTGEDCEVEVNACDQQPCLKGQICIDKTAEEQSNITVGFSCGPCPEGFEVRGQICVDINECLNNRTSSACPDHAVCTNFVGSFSCTCDQGYRLDPTNSSNCKDIDECAERTHKCQQVCENTEGSYLCSCFPGNTLTSDGKACQRDLTSASQCNTLGCSQACVVEHGNAVCSCNAGYQLSGTSQCVDINECTSGNKPCSQACENNNGGFQCSCYTGYKLALDNVTCTECEQPYFGDNCQNYCVCNGHGQCHTVKGCECETGWTGPDCRQDVNECSQFSPCPIGELCINTLGSYLCACQEGYTWINGACQDIDECSNVLAHSCNLAAEDCINTSGNYTCVCRSGYARNKHHLCEDINECTTKTHNCNQVCENTPGKFNCKCYYGYRLDNDRVSCIPGDSDVCAAISSLECDHICTVDLKTNTPYCVCRSGYALVSTDKCVDIDECQYDHLNLCTYKHGCQNTNGSYTCTCQLGWQLDNDGRTCIGCNGGQWGVACSSSCSCSTGATGCDPQKGCVCKPGFKGFYCEKDVDECATGLLTCVAGEKCVNTVGGASCHCLDGYTGTLDKCLDVNECASRMTNNCDQVCENYDGGYSCSCHNGYRFNTTSKICEDVDECILQLHKCQQVCENTGGGYRCACQDGQKIDADGLSCKVISKCQTKACVHECAVINGLETCICPRGQISDPRNDSQCIDKDMCLGSPCTDGCVESPDGKSFTCTCPAGKQLASDGFNCVECTEGKYGVNCSQKCACDPITTQSCNKVNGTCVCQDGWMSSTCTQDKNECQTSKPCQLHSTCINTPGTYKCRCLAGYYTTSQGQCEVCPDNMYGEECQHKCQCDMSHSTCDSMSGLCYCHSGWIGAYCDIDLDECDGGTHNCSRANRTQWVCFNTPGSYRCGCDTGYELSENMCTDLDECALDFTNRCDQNCTNTEGNYTCACTEGYQLGPDGFSCEDVDECASGANICQQVCDNQPGTYSCCCAAGYEISDQEPTQCYEAENYTLSMRLPIDVTSKNLKERRGKDYLQLKQFLEPELEKNVRLPGLKKIVIQGMRHGSLIVDFTAVVNKTDNPDAASNLVEAILLLSKTGLIVNGTLQDVTVVIGNVAVPPTQDKCVILQAIKPCESGETCSVNDAEAASCRSSGEEEDKGLIIGLAVGLPLAVALAVATGTALYYKKNYKKQRRVNARKAPYNNERISTPNADSCYPVASTGTHVISVWSEKSSNKTSFNEKDD